MAVTREANGQAKPRRRLLHWVVAAAFLIMVVTGLMMMVPAFSAAASGGWTRLIHRIAAVLLVGGPLVYGAIHPREAWAWLKEALLITPGTSPGHIPTWKRIHKALIVIGFVLLGVTGAFQWFLKGIVPGEAFQVALLIHDITFFSALVVFLYHVYYELDWWLWKRRYCAGCDMAYCAEVCPSAALMVSSNRGIERHTMRCDNCRLCMEICRRKGYNRKTVHGVQTSPSRGAPESRAP